MNNINESKDMLKYRAAIAKMPQDYTCTVQPSHDKKGPYKWKLMISNKNEKKKAKKIEFKSSHV